MKKVYNNGFQNSESGFGLVELLISLTLITIVVMSFGGLISNGAILSRSNSQENIALGLAQDKLEDIKSHWPSKPLDFGNNIQPESNVAITKNNTTFYRSWDYNVVDSSDTSWTDPNATSPATALYSKYLIGVTVTVTWDQTGRSGTVRRSTGVITYMTGR